MMILSLQQETLNDVQERIVRGSCYGKNMGSEPMHRKTISLSKMPVRDLLAGSMQKQIC